MRASCAITVKSQTPSPPAKAFLARWFASVASLFVEPMPTQTAVHRGTDLEWG